MPRKRVVKFNVGGRARVQKEHLDHLHFGANKAGNRISANLRVQRDDLPMDVFYRVLSKGKSK